MYRIRMADGSEASYATVEEFSAAVVDGRVPATAEIYHQRAEKWLAIAAHPHFKAALERGGTHKSAAAPATNPMAGSGKRPALRIPTVPAPSPLSSTTNGTTAPRVPAAPKPAPRPAPETAPRAAVPSPMVSRLHAELAAETKPQTTGPVAPISPVAAQPPAPRQPSASQPAAPAPADPTEAIELLPENELPPFAPPAAVKPPTVPSRPKLPAVQVREPTSPLAELHPLEPEMPAAELAPAPVESLAPTVEKEVTSDNSLLAGLPLVEVPESAGPLPYVADHAPPPPAPRRSAPAPVVSSAPAVSVPAVATAPVVPPPVHHSSQTIEAPDIEPVHHSAPKSHRGLLVAAGIAAVLIIGVTAFLLRPSASEAANAESVQVSTSAAQQAQPPQSAPAPTTLAPPATAAPEPSVERGARVEPARPERASRNRVDPTPAETSAGDGEIVPAARLPVPTAIDASLKAGVEPVNNQLIDRDKALEKTRKAIVDRDR